MSLVSAGARQESRDNAQRNGLVVRARGGSPASHRAPTTMRTYRFCIDTRDMRVTAGPFVLRTRTPYSVLRMTEVEFELALMGA